MSDPYGGSQLFAGLAERAGLATHHFNFLLCQLAALALATLFRTALHPAKTSAAARQTFGLAGGLLAGYFCFGARAAHLAALPALCYAVMRTQRPRVVPGAVLAAALGYVSCLHAHRQVYEYGSAVLDISGPLMVITQKVSSLAFSLHDGTTRTQRGDQLTANQKYHAVYRTPTPLEYFGYTLLFPSLMAGPVIFYNDYVDFIEGTNYAKARGTATAPEPSPVRVVCKKLLVALACAYVFVKFLPRFPVATLASDRFLHGTGLLDKLWYLTVCTTLVRFKYYFAWTMADAVCNNSGLGFDGTAEWGKVSNVDIVGFEFATSLKGSIAAWNKGTNAWLRLVVYERTRRHRTLLTYALSAVWHGFYPGYYLTFLGGALFTFAARTARRHVRGAFAGSRVAKLLYDVFTFAVTHLALAYLTFPFVLLEFWPSVSVFNQMFWCFHVASVLIIVLVPRMVPESTQKELSSNSIAFALKQAS